MVKTCVGTATGESEGPRTDCREMPILKRQVEEDNLVTGAEN